MSCGESVIVPTSTSEYQIFPLGACSNNYNAGDYDHEFAEGKASYMEVTQVLNAIQLARKPATSKMMTKACLFTLIYLVLIVIAVFIRVILFGAGSLAGLIFMVIFLILTSSAVDAWYKKEEYKANKESMDNCYKVLDEQYKAAFEAKGLRWFLPTHFPRWIELQKIGNYQSTAQPVYVPPNQHQNMTANDMNVNAQV